MFQDAKFVVCGWVLQDFMPVIYLRVWVLGCEVSDLFLCIFPSMWGLWTCSHCMSQDVISLISSSVLSSIWGLWFVSCYLFQNVKSQTVGIYSSVCGLWSACGCICQCLSSLIFLCMYCPGFYSVFPRMCISLVFFNVYPRVGISDSFMGACPMVCALLCFVGVS